MRKAKKSVDEIKDIAHLEQQFREFEFKRLEKERSKVTKNLAKLIVYTKMPRWKRMIRLNLNPDTLLAILTEIASIVLSIKLMKLMQLEDLFGFYVDPKVRFNAYVYLLSFVGTVLFALMFMEILIVSFKTSSEKELSELIKTEKDRIKEIDKHKAILIKDSGRSYQSE